MRIALFALVLFCVWHMHPREELASGELTLFIEHNVLDVAKTPPDEVRLKHLLASLSDGQFDQLPEHWRQDMARLVRNDSCREYDTAIWFAVEGDRVRYMLAKAQMMVESQCRPTVIGGGTDYGLFQVQHRACKDVGVDGDLLDPYINVDCALAYSQAICQRYGVCATVDRLVAYNAGPTGSEKIKDKKSFDYVRRVHYALTLAERG